MGWNPLDAIGDLLESIGDFIQSVWDDIVMPMLEETFSWFGIEDETLVIVQKVSIPILEVSSDEYVRAAVARTVIGMIKNGHGFYDNYVVQMARSKGQINSYYNYARGGGYSYGLPTSTTTANSINLTEIKTAIDGETGQDNVVAYVIAINPASDLYFKHALQSSPTNYNPHAETMTATATSGVSYADWAFVDSSFNNTTLQYDISISRTGELTKFWITSDASVEVGSTGTITVHTNRAVPAGQSITVDLIYSGTPVNGIDFNAPASVTLTAGTTFATATVDSVTVTNADKITVGINVNNIAIYEDVVVWPANANTDITLHPVTPTLVVPYGTMQEGNTVVLPVTLSSTTSGPFTVDYATVDNATAVAGSDYTAASGTLNFAGTAGEVQNISVTALNDSLSESFDEFGIQLSNSSDLSVAINVLGRVRITDNPTAVPAASTGTMYQVLNRPNFTSEKHVMAVYYNSTQTENEWWYWLYRVASNTYPNINPQTTDIVNTEMLPVSIIRKNKQFIDQEQDLANNLFEDFGVDTEIYRTTQQLLRKVKLPVKDVIENVGANPDINYVDDCFVNFAVSPYSVNPAVSKLLWNIFYDLHITQGLTSNIEQYALRFAEQDANNAVLWTQYELLTNVNFADYLQNIVDTPFYQIELHNTAVADTEIGNYGHFVTRLYATGGASWKPTKKVGLHIFKKLTETHGDILVISNLSGMSAISYQAHHNAAFTSSLDKNFTIPISWPAIRSLSNKEVVELFPHIFRVDVFSIQVVELAFYETAAFQLLFRVVMIIITIYSLGTATSFWAALGQMLFNYLIIQVIIRIAELTGNAELAVIVGIIAAVSIGYYGGFSFDVTTIDGLTNVVTQFANALNAAAGAETYSLQQELNAMLDAFETQRAEQEAANIYNIPINGTTYLSLLTPDSQMYLARDIQYNFDLLFNYDNLVADYYDNQLITGVR